MIKLFKKILYLINILILCGCTSSSDLEIKKVNFSSFNDLKADFKTLIINNQYANKIEAPYIDYYVPEKLGNLTKKWVEKRFETQNKNSTNTLKITILKANTLGFSLDSKAKIENILDNNASIRIEMYIKTYIELLNSNGAQLAYCEIEIYKGKELGENISLMERDYQIQEMTKSIFFSFDRLAVSKIKDVFKDYLSNS